MRLAGTRAACTSPPQQRMQSTEAGGSPVVVRRLAREDAGKERQAAAGPQRENRAALRAELREELRAELRKDFQAMLDGAVRDQEERQQRVARILGALQEQLTAHDTALDDIAGETTRLSQQGTEHANALDAIAGNATLLQDYVEQSLLVAAKRCPWGAAASAPPPPSFFMNTDDATPTVSVTSPCASPAHTPGALVGVRRRLLNIRASLATEAAATAEGEAESDAPGPQPSVVAATSAANGIGEVITTELDVDATFSLLKPKILELANADRSAMMEDICERLSTELKESVRQQCASELSAQMIALEERSAMMEDICESLSTDLKASVRQQCDSELSAQMTALEERATYAGAAAAGAALHKAWDCHREDLAAAVAAELKTLAAEGALQPLPKEGLQCPTSPSAAQGEDAAEPCPEQACGGEAAQDDEKLSESSKARLQLLEERVESLAHSPQRTVAAEVIEPLIDDIRHGLKHAESTKEQISGISDQLARLGETVDSIGSKQREDAVLAKAVGRRLEQLEKGAVVEARFHQLEERVDSLTQPPAKVPAAESLEPQIMDLQRGMKCAERTAGQVTDICDQLARLREVLEGRQREDVASREAASRRLDQLESATLEAREQLEVRMESLLQRPIESVDAKAVEPHIRELRRGFEFLEGTMRQVADVRDDLSRLNETVGAIEGKRHEELAIVEKMEARLGQLEGQTPSSTRTGGGDSVRSGGAAPGVASEGGGRVKCVRSLFCLKATPTTLSD